MNYRYDRLVTSRHKRQPHETSSIRRHVKDLRTLMKSSDGVKRSTEFHFYSRFVKKCDPEQISEVQAYLIIPNFRKGKALDHILASMNAPSYAGFAIGENTSPILSRRRLGSQPSEIKSCIWKPATIAVWNQWRVLRTSKHNSIQMW